MSAGEALLRAIIENPEDDTPRLIYADWLEENGDEARAEFIRIQVELARMPEGDPRLVPLHHRQRRLLRGNRAVWEAERPGWAGTGKGEFVRGFLVPRLKEPVARFVRRAPEDFDPFPLWHITLTGLASVPEKNERVAELAACSNLLRAAGLNLTANAIGSEGARRLAASPHLVHVRALSLHRNWMGAEGIRALAELAAWPLLRILDLGGNQIDNEGAAVLARASFLANLTELDLRFNGLRDGAAGALAGSPHLGRLRILVLAQNYVGDRGAQALASAPWVRGLNLLALANQVGDAGAQALARSPHLDSLEKLILDDNHRLGEEGCRALRERFGQRVVLPRRYR